MKDTWKLTVTYLLIIVLMLISGIAIGQNICKNGHITLCFIYIYILSLIKFFFCPEEYGPAGTANAHIVLPEESIHTREVIYIKMK